MNGKPTKSPLFWAIVALFVGAIIGYYIRDLSIGQKSSDGQDYSKNDFNNPISYSDFQIWLKRQDEGKSKLDQVRDHCKKGNLGAALEIMEQENHPEYTDNIVS